MDAAISEHGQFTLEQSLLDYLGVAPGGQVSIRKLPGGRLEIEAKKGGWTPDEAKRYFRRLLAGNTIHASIDDMNAAIAAGYARSGLGEDGNGSGS